VRRTPPPWWPCCCDGNASSGLGFKSSMLVGARGGRSAQGIKDMGA
jgi:hypothetical protein